MTRAMTMATRTGGRVPRSTRVLRSSGSAIRAVRCAATGNAASAAAATSGAIERTDVDPTVYWPAEPDATRSAVVTAALALAVLRDPASSALEE